MAVTGFWPVYGNLKATLDYADNPDKTTPKEYLDKDLYSALRYAENDNKTDRQVFVGGINCSKQNAYTEMIAVQRRFGMKGKVVAYHGIQSFKAGEVTPEEAFEIGKETARRMWGNKYQVLVTVHLNTDNLHCHFVVNPCSFKNGAKFKNKIGDHLELRKVSDEVCREHGLRNVKKYVSEYRFLQAEKLNTMTDIKNYIDTTKAEINKFERSRALIDNKRRRAKTPEEKQQYKDERKAITEHITPLRKKLKQAVQIYNKSPRLIDLLDREYQIERKTYERTK